MHVILRESSGIKTKKWWFKNLKFARKTVYIFENIELFGKLLYLSKFSGHILMHAPNDNTNFTYLYSTLKSKP